MFTIGCAGFLAVCLVVSCHDINSFVARFAKVQSYGVFSQEFDRLQRMIVSGSLRSEKEAEFKLRCAVLKVRRFLNFWCCYSTMYCGDVHSRDLLVNELSVVVKTFEISIVSESACCWIFLLSDVEIKSLLGVHHFPKIFLSGSEICYSSIRTLIPCSQRYI